jgi:pyruvate formate lyase activating enzyme
MKETLIFEKLANNDVRCNLCAHHCVIMDGKKGVWTFIQSDESLSRI